MSMYDVTDYGAVGDGVTVSTNGINAAIQACTAAGGGTVAVPPGIYLSGTIDLKSNVELRIALGATIKGSTDLSHYRPMGAHRGHEGMGSCGLFYAEEAANIAVTGLGRIDGSGTAFMGETRTHAASDFDRQFTRQGEDYLKNGEEQADGPLDHGERPGWMFWLVACENLRFSDFTILDSPEWAFRLDACVGVYATGLTIRNNPEIANSDGIHCANCRNVRISDCDIDSGDDCIALSNHGDRPGDMEDVVVSNCVLRSRSAAVRVNASESWVRRCRFANLVVRESNRGFGIFVRKKGRMEDIAFCNCTIETRLHHGHWWGQAEPIHVSATGDSDSLCRGLTFSGIRARSEAGIVLYGTEACPVLDVTLDAVRIELTKGVHDERVGGNFDLRHIAEKSRAIFEHEIPAVYVQHGRNLLVRDLDVCWAKPTSPYFTHALEVVDTGSLSLRGLRGTASPGREELDAVRFERVSLA